MSHERDECSLVRLEVGARARRQNVDGRTVGADDSGKTLEVSLHPFRHVVHVAVLPRSEPKQDNMHVVLACALDQEINVLPIKTSFLWLDLLPVDWSLDRVRMKFGKRLPYRRQLRRPGAGVVHLPAQHQKWLSVDEQSPAPVLLNERRRLICRSGRVAEQ